MTAPTTPRRFAAFISYRHLDNTDEGADKPFAEVKEPGQVAQAERLEAEDLDHEYRGQRIWLDYVKPFSDENFF